MLEIIISVKLKSRNHVALKSTWQSLLSHSCWALAEGKEPVSLEKKTYDNTKEKLGGAQQQQQAPAGAQPAFA